MHSSKSSSNHRADRRERAAEAQSYQEELAQWETLGARAAQSEEQHTATAGALREEAAAARQELAEQRKSRWLPGIWVALFQECQQ